MTNGRDDILMPCPFRLFCLLTNVGKKFLKRRGHQRLLHPFVMIAGAGDINLRPEPVTARD